MGALKKLLPLLLLFSGASNAVRYEVAVDTYLSKDYGQAYKHFMALSQLGNKHAQFNIGQMHLHGHGVDKSSAKANAWMKLAAATGDPKYQLIYSKTKKTLSSSELSESEQEYRSLLSLYDDASLQKQLMPVLTSKAVPPLNLIQNEKPEFSTRGLSASGYGYVAVEFTIGADGRVKHPIVRHSSSSSYDRAILGALNKRVYQAPVRNGKTVEVQGIREVYLFDAEGNAAPSSTLFSKLFAERSNASYGSSRDLYNYELFARDAYDYLDENKRAELANPNLGLVAASVDGITAAQFELSKSLLYGDRCEKDSEKSYFWLYRAAEDGLVEAQRFLGIELISGTYFKQDIDQGLAWLEKAAEESDTAKIEYSRMLVLLKRDPYKAVALLERMNKRSIVDEMSYYEALVLAYDAIVDADGKKKVLKTLLKLAKKRDLSKEDVEVNISLLRSGKPVMMLAR